ncbi:MAG TPA: YncE family protein [Longimicrobiales bacterium]|nr:YncE family protein [Longimicrobiales bacterium]
MTLRGVVGLALTAAAAGCQAASGGPSAASPGAASASLAVLVYVTNQDAASVTAIDANTHAVVATVDLQGLGFSANARPHHVVADPDGSHWYVSLIGENTVLKVDAATNRVVARGSFEVPGMLAYDLETDRLFVGRSMSAVNPPQRIGVMDRDDMSVEEIGVLYPRPHALASNPRSVHVYSASLATNQMAAIDPVAEEVRLVSFGADAGAHDHAGMDHGSGPMLHTMVDFAVSPDGGTLVGTAEMSGKLLVFGLADPGAPRLEREVDVGSRPWHPAYAPDGREVWIPSNANNTVTVVRTADWTVAAVLAEDGFAEPYGATFSPDGRWVFVSNSDTKNEYPGEGGTVVVMDARTRAVVKVIPVGRNPTGIGTRARP